MSDTMQRSADTIISMTGMHWPPIAGGGGGLYPYSKSFKMVRSLTSLLYRAASRAEADPESAASLWESLQHQLACAAAFPSGNKGILIENEVWGPV